MKKFEFRLARVMEWRQIQVQSEESKLERIYAELRAVEARITGIRAATQQSESALVQEGSATGYELVALDNFKKALASERIKLERAAVDLRKRVETQLQVVMLKRRDVRLLEHLRARKLAAWNADVAKAIDLEAGELHLISLGRRKAGDTIAGLA